MIPLIGVVKEGLVDEVERIHGLQVGIVIPALELLDVSLGGVEKHALEEVGRPYHLHLNDELPLQLVLATHVDDGVLLQRHGWYKLKRKVLDACHLPVVGQWQHGIEEAYHQVLVVGKDLLECQIGSWIKVFSHTRAVFRKVNDFIRSEKVFSLFPQQ